MSYATWIDALPTRLKTQEEKLEILRQKFLPEPMITTDMIYGQLKIRMERLKLDSQIAMERMKWEIYFGE